MVLMWHSSLVNVKQRLIILILLMMVMLVDFNLSVENDVNVWTWLMSMLQFSLANPNVRMLMLFPNPANVNVTFEPGWCCKRRGMGKRPPSAGPSSCPPSWPRWCAWSPDPSYLNVSSQLEVNFMKHNFIRKFINIAQFDNRIDLATGQY